MTAPLPSPPPPPGPKPPNPRHVTGPLAYLRPAVLLAVTTWALLTRTMPVFVAGSLAMFLEIEWWAPRFAWLAWRRPLPPAAVVIAGLGAWIVNPARLAAGLVIAWWWAIGAPLAGAYRYRWHTARQRHAQQRAQKRAVATQQFPGALPALPPPPAAAHHPQAYTVQQVIQQAPPPPVQQQPIALPAPQPQTQAQPAAQHGDVIDGDVLVSDDGSVTIVRTVDDRSKVVTQVLPPYR